MWGQATCKSPGRSSFDPTNADSPTMHWLRETPIGGGPLDFGRLGPRYQQMRIIACAVGAAGLFLLAAAAWPPASLVAFVIMAVGIHAYWRARQLGPAFESLVIDATALILAVAVLAPPAAAVLPPALAVSTAGVLFLESRRALVVAAYATIGISAALTWAPFSVSVQWNRLESLGLVAMSVGALSPLMWWLLRRTGEVLEEHHALGERLKDRENRYRMIAESVSDAIISADEKGIILYANPAVERIFGHRPDDLVGEDVQTLVPERYRPAHQRGLRRYLETGRRRRDWTGMDLTGLHKDGRELDLEVSFGESNGPDGRRFIGMVRDITERREAEKALRISEARYRGLFEGVPVGVYRTSLSGEVLDANPMLAELLGYDHPSELIGLQAQDFYVEPSDRERWRQYIDEASVLAGHEMQLRRADGTAIWVRDSARDLHDDTGQIFGYEGTLEDITLRRNAEDRLRAMVDSQQRRLLYEKALSACSQSLLAGSDDQALEAALESLLKATGVGSVFVERNENDPDLGLTTNLVYELNSLRQAPEYERWRGVPWSQMPLAHSRLSIGEPFGFAVSELEGQEGNLYEGTPTKSELDIPIFVGGEWIGLIGFADFEAERPWREEEINLLRTAAQMIGAFWERRRAHRELQELVRYKDEFVASVSHELRTPLTAVVGLAEELAESSQGNFTGDELSEFHGLIAQQSREVAYIVEDLLVAARVEIETVSIDAQPVDLDAEIATTIRGWPSEFGHIGHTASDVKVLADPTRLRQITRNLLTNAIRYGGDRVRVVTGAESECGFLQVRDDGPGISPEDLERIFEPYQRASSIPAVRPGSVGLGLYVSRQLACLMGGDLTCRREDSETVFELSVPLL